MEPALVEMSHPHENEEDDIHEKKNLRGVQGKAVCNSSPVSNSKSRVKNCDIESTGSSAEGRSGSSNIHSNDVGNNGSSNVGGPTLMSRMALNDNKAGMEGLDKEKINQIIYEASKGSKFYENERKKEEQLDLKIKEQQMLVDSIADNKLCIGLKEADQLLKELEQQRDLYHTIVHVDMDAFYAAVEMRDNPSLRNKPMAVGGMGMLSTSNYLARRYGVRAAMPGFIGLKLCPDLVIVKPNFEQYTAVSHEIRKIMEVYDPNFSPMSLDEAYLDFTNHLEERLSSSRLSRTFLFRQDEGKEQSKNLCSCDLNEVLRPSLFNLEDFQLHNNSDTELKEFVKTLQRNTTLLKKTEDSTCDIYECSKCQKSFPEYTIKVYGLNTEDAVLEMRNRIEHRTHLTASAGIAPNTMLAKVCSDMNKPNGQFRIHPDKNEVEKFVNDLPIRKISGIGKVTEKLLQALNVVTCNDLFKQRALLYHLFSPISFNHFMRIALGIGSTCVERDGDRKSMSTERTFHELSQPSELMEKCQELCHSLAKDLQDDQLEGKTVTLKIKTVSFQVRTRSYTLQHYTCDEKTIFSTAKHLLKTEIEAALPGFLRLRLMGVRMSKLINQSSSQTTVSNMFKNYFKHGSAAALSASNGASVDGELSSHKIHPVTAPGAETGPCEFISHDGDKVGMTDSDEEMEHFQYPLHSKDSSTTVVQLECKTSFDSMSSRKKAEGAKRSPLKKKQQKRYSKEESILKFVCKKDDTDSVTIISSVNSGCPDQVESKQKTSNSIVDVVMIPEEGDENTLQTSSSVKQTIPHEIHSTMIEEKTATTLASSLGKVISQAPCPSSKFQISAVEFEQNSQHLTSSSDSNLSIINETLMVSCPVCGQQIRNWALDSFNAHVDLCLSRQTIKDILQDQQQGHSLTMSQTQKRQRQGVHDVGRSGKRSKTQLTVTSFFKS